MSKEEDIRADLTSKFSYLEGKIIIPRPKRIFLELSPDNLAPVLSYAAEKLEFPHLCTITGLDEQDKLSFIYHLAQDRGILLNIKISVPRDNPVLKTITPYFPGAEIYERELVDLFGAKVVGLPEGNRYPLTDDWPAGQFPLRKDWKPDTQADKKESNHA